MPFLPDDVIEIAASVLSRRRQLMERLQTAFRDTLHLPRNASGSMRDYHLGQVLRVNERIS